MKKTIRISQAGRVLTLIKQRGFTLLELMIVLVIMGLAMAVVAPRFGGALDRAEIRTALRDTSDLLRTAHAQAVVKRENWRVRIDREEGVLSLLGPQTEEQEEQTDESDVKVAKLISLPKSLKITDFEIGKTVKNASSAKKSRKKDSGQNENDIVFYPLGNSTGCRLEFRDGLEREYAIEVNPFTSRVKVIHEASKKS